MSQVAICNKALSYLGGRLIISIDDQTKEAELCKANYDSARKATLEARAWTFATARTQLVVNATPPSWGYTNQFQLPGDVLRIIEARNDKQVDKANGMEWAQEGNQILADSDSMQILYIRDIINTAQFSQSFSDAISARLSHDIAGGLTQSTKLVEQAWQLYEIKLSEAAALDGLQGRNKVIRSNNLTGARLAGASTSAGPFVNTTFS